MPNTLYQTPGGPKGDIIQFTGDYRVGSNTM